MKRAACDRSWQVEAARDGRLSESAAVSLSLHVAGCAVCQGEQRALTRLALTLRETALEIDDVAMRRLRQQTLEKANAALMKPAFTARQLFGRTQDRTPRWRALGVALGVAIAVTLAAAALLFLRPKSESAPASAVLVQADSGAKWQRHFVSDVEHVNLTAGTLLFRVARRPTDRRLIVRVPDGEIEDLGTTFSVTVKDGKTSEIVVREGRVLFHRRGASALHLVAGSSWTPPPELAQPAERSSPPELGPLPESSSVNANVNPDPPKRPARKAPRVAQPKPVVAAESAGEDEAYLHMLALLREGRTAEARLAAHAYLRTFPGGFRHVEVARVADMRDLPSRSAAAEKD